MNDNDLRWEIKYRRLLLSTPVFDVTEQREVSATGIEGGYVAIEAPDWAMVIPDYEGRFILVRQWRHSSETMSLEFPGGVVDEGEEPEQAARRELTEETGFKAKELIHLGSVSPNPALFKNRFHIYLARGLEATGEQSLDDDELLNYLTKPIEEVINGYGKGEYSHALMGTALAFYLRDFYKST